MPTLALTKCSTPSIENGWAKAAATRSAIANASSSSARRSMRTPNSSPPKRATMSPGRRWARRRGATARSRASPAWWPRLSLISLKWSRSRKRIPIGEPEAVARLQRVVEGVDEAEAVRQSGQRVVQDAVAQGLVGGVALDRVGQHVGGGLDEGDVLGTEAVRLGGVDVEHPERVILAVDHHRQAARGADHPQHRRHREAALARPIGDDRVRCRTRARRRRGSRGRRRRGDRRRRPRPRGRREG